MESILIIQLWCLILRVGYVKSQDRISRGCFGQYLSFDCTGTPEKINIIDAYHNSTYCPDACLPATCCPSSKCTFPVVNTSLIFQCTGKKFCRDIALSVGDGAPYSCSNDCSSITGYFSAHTTIEWSCGPGTTRSSTTPSIPLTTLTPRSSSPHGSTTPNRESSSTSEQTPPSGSTTPNTTSSSTSEQPSSSKSPALIGGVVVGTLALVALLAVGIFFFIKRRRTKKIPDAKSNPEDNTTNLTDDQKRSSLTEHTYSSIDDYVNHYNSIDENTSPKSPKQSQTKFTMDGGAIDHYSSIRHPDTTEEHEYYNIATNNVKPPVKTQGIKVSTDVYSQVIIPPQTSKSGDNPAFDVAGNKNKVDASVDRGRVSRVSLSPDEMEVFTVDNAIYE